MTKRRLGRTELFIEPLVFGCNVLGWTLEESTAYGVLDALLDGGFAAVDTADSYGKGKSETILGNWMKARGNRDKVLVFTKVGSDMGQGHRDLSAKWIEEEVDASLTRLQTDYIDLYQTHWPDPNTPQEETLAALDRVVKAGKVRYIGSSNQDTALLTESLAISKANGLARYETIQNEFNLYDRAKFEEVQATCVAEEISGIGYFSLARGFLAGKYRSAADAQQSPRGQAVVEKYLNPKGFSILKALDAISKRTGATPAEVSLAWVAAQPGVGAPIASATSVEQLASLMKSARLTLSAEDIKELTDAGK
ncbi:aldo/keto reductase [Devosia sp. CN2-171]|jgi:aryl-alcohol dehydrogenase-like predicted oxidoreductase|uniref:aldo/keto reductase n=1 Tax=Devosia sp. CN2-171 TaxID=3400909 RepID=UPI003BF8F5E1